MPGTLPKGVRGVGIVVVLIVKSLGFAVVPVVIPATPISTQQLIFETITFSLLPTGR